MSVAEHFILDLLGRLPSGDDGFAWSLLFEDLLAGTLGDADHMEASQLLALPSDVYEERVADALSSAQLACDVADDGALAPVAQGVFAVAATHGTRRERCSLWASHPLRCGDCGRTMRLVLAGTETVSVAAPAHVVTPPQLLEDALGPRFVLYVAGCGDATLSLTWTSADLDTGLLPDGLPELLGHLTALVRIRA